MLLEKLFPPPELLDELLELLGILLEKFFDELELLDDLLGLGLLAAAGKGYHLRSELLNSLAAFKPRSRKPAAAAAPRRGDGPVEADEAVTLLVSAASLPPGGPACARPAAGGGPMYVGRVHTSVNPVCARACMGPVTLTG